MRSLPMQELSKKLRNLSNGQLTESSPLLANTSQDHDIELGSVSSSSSSSSSSGVKFHQWSQARPFPMDEADLEALPSEAREMYAAAQELVKTNSGFRQAMETILKSIRDNLKVPARVTIDTLMLISIWAMFEDNFQGFSNDTKHETRLDKYMLPVFLVGSYINIAHAIMKKQRSKLHAAISIAYSFIQATASGIAAANFLEDFDIDAYIQATNPGSGSTGSASDSSNDALFLFLFLPGAAMGFTHGAMQFTESMYKLAEEYEFGIEAISRLKSKIPTSLQTISSFAYKGLRFISRGLFSTGSVLNETVHTGLVDFGGLKLSSYKAWVRTSTYAVPFAIGLLSEVAVNLLGSSVSKFAGEITREAIDLVVQILTSAMNAIDYGFEYAQMDSEDGLLPGITWMMIILSIVAIPLIQHITNKISTAKNEDELRAEFQAIREQMDLLVDNGHSSSEELDDLNLDVLFNSPSDTDVMESSVNTDAIAVIIDNVPSHADVLENHDHANALSDAEFNVYIENKSVTLYGLSERRLQKMEATDELEESLQPNL